MDDLMSRWVDEVSEPHLHFIDGAPYWQWGSVCLDCVLPGYEWIWVTDTWADGV